MKRGIDALIRCLAILLVLFGRGEKVAAQEDDTAKPVDDKGARDPGVDLTPAQIAAWREFTMDRRVRRGKAALLRYFADRTPDTRSAAHGALRLLAKRLPPSMMQLLERCLDPRRSTLLLPVTDSDLLVKAMTELGERGLHDPALDSILFALTSGLPDELAPLERRRIFSALSARVGISHRLVLGLSHIRPITLSAHAWGSKAGPHRQIRAAEKKLRQELARRLEALRDAPLSSWMTEAATGLRVAKGRVILVREGVEQVIEAGDSFRFGRLDLLRSEEGAVLSHAWLGEMDLPPARLFDVWGLPDLLTGDARMSIGRALLAAGRGDETGAGLLELSLPFCHAALMRELSREGHERPMRDRWQSILLTFSDLVPFVPKEAVAPRKR